MADTFTVKDGEFCLNGEPFKIYSGAIHYFRTLPEYWEDRLLKLKKAGFNTVETYVCWNLHEPREGEFDFSFLDEIIDKINDMIQGTATLEDLLQLVRQKKAPLKEAMELMEAIIKISNLKKTFVLSNKQMKQNKTKDKYKKALNGLSLSINKGEIYGLLGPNGAGKTTTLRIMSTLIKADEGEVLIDKYNVKSNQTEIRKNIAFLTSELKLEEFFTVDYMYDFYSNLHDVPNDIRDKQKEKLYTQFGIHDFKYTKVGELSTEGKFMHMFTLTVGSKVTVRSKADANLFAICDKFQTLVIPASFGDYEIINEEGGRVTCVIQRWKKG